MRARLGVIVVTALLAAVALSSVHAAGASEVVIEISTDRAVYEASQEVVVTVIVTNQGADAATLHFMTSLTAYYVVMDSWGNTVFDLSLHVKVAMVLTEMTLEPGESKTYTYDDTAAWNQVDDDGESVPFPEDYVMMGLLDTDDPYQSGSVEISLGDGLEAVPEFSSGLVVPVALSGILVIVFLMKGRRRQGC